jgi:hypothetical protein
LRRPRPKKITPSLAVISFSKAGTVRKRVEAMPDDQDALEELVVQRFVSALNERYGRKVEIVECLSKERRDPPDFLAIEGGKTVGIEVTEVVEPSHRRLHSARQNYGKVVQETLLERGNQLRGIIVRIFDAHGEPSYPPTHSKQGEEIIASVVRLVEERQAHLAELVVGAERHVRLPSSVCSWAVFQRVAENNEECGAIQVEFTGGYVISRDSLITAIRSKTGKNYLLPCEADLWLLAYGLLVSGDPESIETASRELSVTTHPFAEVWYAHLIPSGRGDILLDQVWRKEESNSGSF